jgi:hypothetical protein
MIVLLNIVSVAALVFCVLVPFIAAWAIFTDPSKD